MEQNRCTEEKLMKESCISLFTVFSTCGSSSIKVDIYIVHFMQILLSHCTKMSCAH